MSATRLRTQIAGAGAAALAAALPGGADAQPQTLEPVVVLGVRASAQSALDRKAAQLGVIDAVVASDIDKLPDLSVSDAVQRVTGVQITRDRGEGSVIAVRGLTQVETTLNGREIFTAGNARTLDYADVAAEMLAGIDVYKSSAADRLEGGIGGSVDLRTRQPFDFPGNVHVLSVRAIHGELVDRTAGQISALVSRRYTLDGGGQFGALLNVALQNRPWREDQKSAGNPTVRNDLVPGTAVAVPNGTSETVSTGMRRRSTASLLLQWRPHDALELSAEAHYAELRTTQDSNQINVTAGNGFVPGSVTLFPGTADLRSITWTDAPFSVLSFARDVVDRTQQLAAGGRWRGDALTLSGDVSVTRSTNRLFFSGPFFGGRVAQFSQDFSGPAPATRISGTDLLDPANLAYTGIAYRTVPFSGGLTALRLDAQWHPGLEAVEQLAFGWRRALRHADNAPGLVFADAPLTGVTAADTPTRMRPNPTPNLLDGRVPSIGEYLVGSLGDARDPVALRNAFGITTPIPPGGSPLGVWQIREQTDALYALATFGRPQLGLDGNAGMRVVQTRTSVDGAQSVPGGVGLQPIAIAATHTDWLPSANLRYRWRDDVTLRVAASRTLTRPDFNQLSPSLTLVPNPVNPTLNQGSAGNPALEAIRATNLDLAVEHHASVGHASSLTLFWKKVTGFVATFSQPEEQGGAIYQVSRPYNSDPADVHGVELATLQFLDFLPGAWRGLGLQANYSYVDSRTPDRRLGTDVPLQNLSRHSGNLVALYEFGRVSARLAYNWRSHFLSGVSSFVGIGAVPAYTRGYGWVDASVTLRVDERLTLALEGSNLGDTLRQSYYGTPTRPQNAFVNGRQLAIRASLSF